MHSDIQVMFETFQRNIANLTPTQCTRTHADTPHVPQADPVDNRNKTTTVPSPFDPHRIIQGAMSFANQVAPQTGDALVGDASRNKEAIRAVPHDTGGVVFPVRIFDAPTDVDVNTEAANDQEREDDMGSSPQLTQHEPPGFMDNDTNSCVETGSSPADGVQRTPSPFAEINPPPLVVVTEPHHILDNVISNAAETGSCPADAVRRTPSTSAENNPPPPAPVTEKNPNLVNVQTNLAFPKPTFSLGLTQEERGLSKTCSVHTDNVDEFLEEVAPIRLTDNEEPFPAHMKSKRQKVVPRALVGDYQCDKRFLTRAWEAHVNSIQRGPNVDYASKIRVLSEKLQTDLCVLNLHLRLSLIKLHPTYVVLTKLIS
ncbi:hypothetical protein Bca4012_057855 [Brassica carinata]|uniref:Uncharacterized protein n=1 Tax=Brassica carinata TaxID=52824 RepID=A0A8X7PNR6_BRACI|nr:hypothetical protein Bca52824_084459 [Brassica carinata]